MEYESFPEHKKRAKEAIDFDPLDLAYHLNDLKENRDTYLLGMYFVDIKAQAERTMLSELCDTYYRMPWEEAREVVESEGFLVTGHYEIEGHSGGRYQQFVAAHPDNKLILTAQSSEVDGREVLDHSMTIHGTVDAHNDYEIFKNLEWNRSSSSYIGDGSKEDDRFAMSWTVTDGLKMTMEGLEKSGATFIDWPAPTSIDAPRYIHDFTFFPDEYYRNRKNGVPNDKEARIFADLPAWARAFMNQ